MLMVYLEQNALTKGSSISVGCSWHVIKATSTCLVHLVMHL